MEADGGGDAGEVIRQRLVGHRDQRGRLEPIRQRVAEGRDRIGAGERQDDGRHPEREDEGCPGSQQQQPGASKASHAAARQGVSGTTMVPATIFAA